MSLPTQFDSSCVFKIGFFKALQRSQPACYREVAQLPASPQHSYQTATGQGGKYGKLAAKKPTKKPQEAFQMPFCWLLAVMEFKQEKS